MTEFKSKYPPFTAGHIVDWLRLNRQENAELMFKESMPQTMERYFIEFSESMSVYIAANVIHSAGGRVFLLAENSDFIEIKANKQKQR